MLMFAPSHIARIVTAEPFNQALSRFRLWNAFSPPLLAVQRNSITQKEGEKKKKLYLLAWNPARMRRISG
jgi:hypothetical protein